MMKSKYLTLSAALLGMLALLSSFYWFKKIKVPSRSGGPHPPGWSSVQHRVETNGLISLSSVLDNPFFFSPAGSKYAWLYIDVKAAKVVTSAEKIPLNISLVLDHSGSMASEKKLEYAREAVKFAIDHMSASDNISLVIYDDNVEVISPSAPVQNKVLFKSKVDRIMPEGSTNLSGGMLEGYSQVKKTYATRNVNKVLLLSDGLANQGITDSRMLREIARKKNAEEGISISTFGVGLDFNEDLMTDLSEYGSGNYYFIGSADKIPEIFAKELKGLLSVAAQNSKLNIHYPSASLDLKNVYGYPYSVSEGNVTIDFKDIFSEEQKGVLLKFEVKQPLDKEIRLETTLTYDDATSFNREELRSFSTLTPVYSLERYNNSFDLEVKRNIALFESNDQMQRALKAVDDRKFEEARKILKEDIQYLDDTFKKVPPDSSLQKQYKNLVDYEKSLQHVEQMGESDFKYMQKDSKVKNYEIKRKK